MRWKYLTPQEGEPKWIHPRIRKDTKGMSGIQEMEQGEERQPVDYLVRPAGIEPATLSLEG